jgi:hypothetical protein
VFASDENGCKLLIERRFDAMKQGQAGEIFGQSIVAQQDTGSLYLASSVWICAYPLAV